MTAAAQAVRWFAANVALPPQHTQRWRVPGISAEALLYPHSSDYTNPETALADSAGPPAQWWGQITVLVVAAIRD